MLARLLHLTLALLLGASSAGATVSVHTCGGRVVDWAVYVAAGTCGMPAPTAAESSPYDAPRLDRAPCCRDELAYHKLDVEHAGDADPAPAAAPATAPVAASCAPSPREVALAAAAPAIRLAARPPPAPAPASQRARRAALCTYRL